MGGESASQPPRLSANDEKVLAYLQQVLDRRGCKTFTQLLLLKEPGFRWDPWAWRYGG